MIHTQIRLTDKRTSQVEIETMWNSSLSVCLRLLYFMLSLYCSHSITRFNRNDSFLPFNQIQAFKLIFMIVSIDRTPLFVLLGWIGLDWVERADNQNVDRIKICLEMVLLAAPIRRRDSYPRVEVLRMLRPIRPLPRLLLDTSTQSAAALLHSTHLSTGEWKETVSAIGIELPSWFISSDA